MEQITTRIPPPHLQPWTRDEAFARLIQLITSPGNAIRNHLLRRALSAGLIRSIWTGPLVEKARMVAAKEGYLSKENRNYRKLLKAQVRERSKRVQ